MSPPFSLRQRTTVLAAGFLAWMFAGFEIALFVLAHRQMSLELLGPGTPEGVITEWFAWYQAAFLLGAATGGWLFGILGDRFGRTHILALSVNCYSLFALACYFADSPNLMLVLRFCACLGIGGVWPNAVALVSEAWPNASRPLIAGVLGAAANVGMVLLGVIAYFVPVTNDDWRWVLLLAASPALLGLLLHVVVPESPKWLASRAVVHANKPASPLGEVLRPPLLSRLLVGIALGAIPVVGSAANANWLVPWTDHANEVKAKSEGTEKKAPADSRQKAKTMITRSGGAIFGSLLGGIVASVLGRRFSYFLISLGALVASTYIFGRLDPLHEHFHLASFALGFIGITYFGWLPLFLPELFPTRVRSTGTGIAFNTGRAVAAVVVLSTGFLLSQFGGDYAQVGLWSGTIYAVGMLAAAFIPKNAGKLED